jgi:hypothetical protein
MLIVVSGRLRYVQGGSDGGLDPRIVVVHGPGTSRIKQKQAGFTEVEVLMRLMAVSEQRFPDSFLPGPPVQKLDESISRWARLLRQPLP